ncbi:Inner membrane protein YqiK [hydrothermal vent metagenome]|uniref:Inner membrane protein YqiK n=1 Tax=hydrothermal vent metagenome TaxID=652676 RepID=A0A3B1DIB9_9ZZZZ
MDFLVITVIVFVVFLFAMILFLASCYKRCASNQILAIYGKVSSGQSVKCFHGGGTFVWPLIQDSQFLDLTPMTINIPLKGALSFQNIRINVPSTFTIAIDTSAEAMNNASVRLLGLSSDEIEKMATEIIFGQLRLTVASLTIEDINQDREKFLKAIRNNIEPELRKIGLTLINVNITDITDESDYIESIGKKAAAIAVNQAKIDVAEESKKGDVGSSIADKERRIEVSKYNAQAVEGENDAKAKIASYDANLAEKEAVANQRGKVAEQNAVVEIQKAKALAETKRLEAEEVVPREIEKRKVEINADATAEKNRREAKGQADAIVSVKTAEAEGIHKVLDAKAEGYNRLVSSCSDNAKDAATMLIVEKLEKIVELQTEAIKNIKIDKVTVWDSGSSEKGSSTANFLSNMVKSLPALHDISAMAGIELPEYLGKTVDNKKVADVAEEAVKQEEVGFVEEKDEK